MNKRNFNKYILYKMVNYIDTPIFDKTRLATPYFQQMTLCSKIPKIIHTPLQNNSHGVECELFWSEVSIILEIFERTVIC